MEDRIVMPTQPAANHKSDAESCAHVLLGLISYHERMTMGNYPERDFYLDALRYALNCVEERAGMTIYKREVGAWRR